MMLKGSSWNHKCQQRRVCKAVHYPEHMYYADDKMYTACMPGLAYT